jgi:hypothetical protein
MVHGHDLNKPGGRLQLRGVRMSSNTASEPCGSCGGRRWKIVSPSRVIMASEDALRLSRRPCLDCAPPASVEPPRFRPSWWVEIAA